MSFNVYRVASAGMPRDHHAIFVETNADKPGQVFQVVGNIQNGMTYGHRQEDLAYYQEKVLIGKVSTANFHRIEPICNSIPPPKKQFDGPRRLNPQEPLRRCQEWTKEAIDALTEAGVLEK